MNHCTFGLVVDKDYDSEIAITILSVKHDKSGLVIQHCSRTFDPADLNRPIVIPAGFNIYVNSNSKVSKVYVKPESTEVLLSDNPDYRKIGFNEGELETTRIAFPEVGKATTVGTGELKQDFIVNSKIGLNNAGFYEFKPKNRRVVREGRQSRGKGDRSRKPNDENKYDGKQSDLRKSRGRVQNAESRSVRSAPNGKKPEVSKEPLGVRESVEVSKDDYDSDEFDIDEILDN
jgi:hypothetical protein